MVSATRDNFPILEFSKGITPDKDPGTLINAEKLAQTQIKDPREVLGEGQPIYLGATFFDMAYPVELNNTRSGPQPIPDDQILVDLIRGAIAEQTPEQLNATERQELAQIQQQNIAEANSEWNALDTAGNSNSGSTTSMNANSVKANVAVIGGGGQPTNSNPIVGVPAYLWRYGCAPTSTAMVLGYWENQGLTELPAVTDTTYGNPLNVDLAEVMGTDIVESGYWWDCILNPLDKNCGGTSPEGISTGITDILSNNLISGWSQSSNFEHVEGYSGDINEINNGYPFLLSLDGGGAPVGSTTSYGQHVIAVIGYDSSENTLIVDDTFHTVPVEIRYGNWQNAMYYKIEHGGDYTIIASAGPGGNIYPSGSQLVVPDFSQSFSIVPNTGYVIQNVETDNDVDHGPIVIYTFSNVVADHSISATFTPITYTISASAGTGGSITPSGSVSVPFDGSQTFTITPASGYVISDVQVDAGTPEFVDAGAASSYTFSNVIASHTISATFQQIPTTYSSSWDWSSQGWGNWLFNWSVSGDQTGPNSALGPEIGNGEGVFGTNTNLLAGSTQSTVTNTFIDPTGVGWNTLTFSGALGPSDVPGGRWMTITVNGQQVFGATELDTPPGDSGQPFTITASFPQTSSALITISQGQDPAWGPDFPMYCDNLALSNENTQEANTMTAQVSSPKTTFTIPDGSEWAGNTTNSSIKT